MGVERSIFADVTAYHATQWLKLETKWIYKEKKASFHMERKRPKRSSIKQMFGHFSNQFVQS